MIRKSLLIALLAVFSCTVFAQQVKISGVVVNEKNKPLEDVAVGQLYTPNGTATTHQGEYTLQATAGDSVKILFSLVGYQPMQVIVAKLSGDYRLNVVLRENDNELGTIIIDGRRKQTDTFLRLSKTDTDLLPSSSGGSIETLVATLAGVSSTSELSSQYAVRGGNFDENMVYINGIEIFRPLLVRTGQQEGLSFINPDMVEAVGFSTGGYGAEYSDKSSSVLDIRYKRPKEFEATVGASLLGGNVSIGNSTKRFSQITGIRYKTNEHIVKKSDTDAEYNPAYWDGQTYMTYKLTSDWEVSFLGHYAYNSYKFRPKSRETKFGTLSDTRHFKVYFNGWERDKFVNYQGALTLNGRVSDHVTIGFTGGLFSSDERERYDIQGNYRLTALDDETGEMLGVGSYMEHARNKLITDVYNASHFGTFASGNHLLKWGITYQKEQVSDKIKEWEMRDSTGYSLPHNEGIVSVYRNLKSNNKLNSSRYSGYLQDNFVVDASIGRFILNAGVRASYWDFNKEFLFSPRASVSFIPEATDRFIARFATGIYYQSSFYKEVQQIVNMSGTNTVVLNEDIKSPRSIHFVLGGDYYFKAQGRSFKFTAEAYYKHLSRLIPYTVNNVKIVYEGANVGDGYTVGLDTRLYGEFIPGTDSWISFSLMKSEQDIRGRKVPLPTDQRYNLSVFFQDYMPGYERLRMSVLGFFSDGLPVTAPYKGLDSGYFRSSAYKRVDIGLSWLLLGEDFPVRKKSSVAGAFKNVWIGLDVFNIFDMKNVNTYYWITDVYNYQYGIPNYMTGRQLNVKLRAEF
ncbi:carboxypeptidase-like regulatory domain-containing protein [Dysgonomonas sp. 25]|uniref:TonB-dependent receptor n=1 Tax=Dysgonomonas sp. 25 TaxID=2302933 RepID=UPI0013D0F2E2|nr:carboxypeptidase-like regulatory domain-containing protein [Dysgonomonas sp. 25]NDV68200.1 TonB-dependent receptor [Dysgonomonas sp. 25]